MLEELPVSRKLSEQDVSKAADFESFEILRMPAFKNQGRPGQLSLFDMCRKDE